GKVRLRIELEFDVSFRDMFAVRGYRGLPKTVEATPVEVIPNGIRFHRLGRDGVRRTTDVTMRPAPDRVDGRTFTLERELAPQEIVTYELALVPRAAGARPPPPAARFASSRDIKGRRSTRSRRRSRARSSTSCGAASSPGLARCRTGRTTGPSTRRRSS